METLDLNPDIICTLITKLKEFHAKEDIVIPEPPDNPDDDWALQVLADHQDDLTLREMKTTIDASNPISKRHWWP